MRALSLWQPYASLIAIGAKEYETRSWKTDYRGDVVIHAAKAKDSLRMCLTQPFARALVVGGYHTINELPLGAFLCIAELVDVVSVESIRGEISDQERAFGDFSNGRCAWKFANIRVFPVPQLGRGEQGLFYYAGNWPEGMAR